MKHLLSIEQLSREEIEAILDRAESFAEVGRRDIKKVPTLRGRTVVTLFYESSTRTSSSFELAAKRLSADLVSVKAAGSSVDKGESLKDTVATLSAYDPAAIVIRHPYAGAAQMVAGWTAAAVVNAGDGKHEHPSQALLDVYTLRRRLGSLEGVRIWIVGDVLHSRVARSNLIAFQRMGAEVTVCGPPTLIPRGIEELGCEVSYTSTGSSEAEVVYALRMQKERMSESFVPSLREYAATFQIDTRRLNPRQLLMHPGPVNRGVELSGEAIDSPQSLIAEQVAAGLVVRMAILYELLAGSERPDPRGRWRGQQADPDRDPGMSLTDTLDVRAGEDAHLVLRRATVLDPVAGIDAVHDVVVRDGEIAELAAPGEADAEGAEVVEAEGLHAFPAFFDPHVHLRTPGHEHKEDVETGTRAAAAGGYCGILAMANTEPPVSTAADISALREQARAGASVPVGFLATVTKAMKGEELTEMVELREAGAIGFSDDGLPIVERRGDAPRPPVPAPLRRQDRPARGGPGALRRRRHARGPGLRRARARRHPLGLGVDDDRPRRRPRRLRGRPDPRPAPLRGGVGRGRPRRQGRRRPDQRRGQPAPPLPHRRGGPQPRPAPLQDEPAAARRERPPGADRGPARRHDRVHRHRPRAAPAGGKGRPLRAGGDGCDRPRDGLRGAPHRAGPAGRRSTSPCWSSGWPAAPRPSTSSGRPWRRARRPTSSSATSAPSGRWGRTATRAARPTPGAPARP